MIWRDDYLVRHAENGTSGVRTTLGTVLCNVWLDRNKNIQEQIYFLLHLVYPIFRVIFYSKQVLPQNVMIAGHATYQT